MFEFVKGADVYVTGIGKKGPLHRTVVVETREKKKWKRVKNRGPKGGDCSVRNLCVSSRKKGADVYVAGVGKKGPLHKKRWILSGNA